MEKERELNQRAYRELKDQLKEKYPEGTYIGILGGEVVATAPSFEEISKELEEREPDSSRGLVYRVGEEPEELPII